jgi:hypothetical protein
MGSPVGQPGAIPATQLRSSTSTLTIRDGRISRTLTASMGAGRGSIGMPGGRASSTTTRCEFAASAGLHRI